MAPPCRPSLLIAFALALLLGGPAPAVRGIPAHQAIDTPAPEECRVGRRSLEALRRLAATPTPAAAEPTADPFAFEPPAGEPADPATVAAITATQREATACANAGDRIRVMSLYSEAFVRRILADAAATGMSVEELYDLHTPGGWTRETRWTCSLPRRLGLAFWRQERSSTPRQS